MESEPTNIPLLAFGFGILSAVSLPLGAVLGIWLKPGDRTVAGIMAFGAGALLAALTFELVGEALERAGFVPLAIGSVLGAASFVLLNMALNQQGAFLRKPATLLKYVRARKREFASDILQGLSQVEILRALPPEEVQAVLPYVKPCSFAAGQRVFEEGETGDALYLVESGEVDILSRTVPSGRVARLGKGDTFGEMALLTGEPRVATAQAVGAVTGWLILKDDFDRLIQASPNLAHAVQELMRRRRETNKQRDEAEREARRWHKQAVKSLEPSALASTPIDVRHVVQAHGGGTPLALWLGNLLDGVAESLVIGTSLVHSAAISAPLVVGLFLANFPEALSSAIGMSRQGYTNRRILWMWGSLMVLMGVGAFVGNVSFRNAPMSLFAAFEAGAAGAMLAMIAETMLPEAFEQGGHLVGMSTLLGFLSAVFVGTLEAAH